MRRCAVVTLVSLLLCPGAGIGASGDWNVFVNSSAGLNSKANVGQYAASKHALKAIADCLREEVNPDGIRVLSIYPGRTATPMQEALYKAEGRTYHPEILMQPSDAAQVVIQALRLPRTVEVTDIHLRPLMKSY